MFTKILVGAAASIFALSAFAAGPFEGPTKSIELKDLPAFAAGPFEGPTKSIELKDLPAFAAGPLEGVTKSIELKDGATVHVFTGGKMGMEDKYGRSVSMNEGHTMETRGGQKIVMIGNETARTDIVLHAQYSVGP